MSNSDTASESSLNFAVLIAVVLAGVAGTVVNAIAAAIVISPAAINLALVPGRYVIAILVAGTLPFIFWMTRQPISSVLGLVVLIVVPSILSKTVFSAPRPWSIVLLLNVVYALVALAVYELAASKMRRS
jgi:hypothetical protein